MSKKRRSGADPILLSDWCSTSSFSASRSLESTAKVAVSIYMLDTSDFCPETESWCLQAHEFSGPNRKVRRLIANRLGLDSINSRYLDGAKSLDAAKAAADVLLRKAGFTLLGGEDT